VRREDGDETVGVLRAAITTRVAAKESDEQLNQNGGIRGDEPHDSQKGLGEAYPPQARVKRHSYLNAPPEKSTLNLSSCSQRIRHLIPRCQAPHDFRRVGQLLLGAGWNEGNPHGSGQWPEQIGAFPIDAPLPSARDGRNWNGELTRIPGDPPDNQPCRRKGLEEKTWSLSSHFDTSHQGWRGRCGGQATSSNSSSSEWERDARGVASFTGAGSPSRESTARSSRQSRRS